MGEGITMSNITKIHNEALKRAQKIVDALKEVKEGIEIKFALNGLPCNNLSFIKQTIEEIENERHTNEVNH